MIDKQRLTDSFLELLQIDSPSGSEENVALYCKAALEAAGCTASIDGSGNVHGMLEGAAPGRIFFAAHMDNVSPCCGVKPLLREDGEVFSDGTTVLGGDDKGGIAAILEALRSLSEGDAPHPSVGVIFTVGEEVGLCGSKALPADFFKGETVLVCDGDAKPGIVDIGAPFHYSFSARFQGRSSHAGVCPEAGISAINMAADAISRMELGRLSNGGSANIGRIEGGKANNIVADCCLVSGECRALQREFAEEAKDSMDRAMKAAARDAGGQVDCSWTLEYEGFLYDESDPMVQRILEAARQCGLRAGTELSGGGTDANILSEKGARPFVLGVGMSDIHSCKEHISLQDIYDLARLLERCCFLWEER